MTFVQEVVLVVLFLITSFIGVVTGSNSLITVPAMFQFGIDPKVAVATNMFGLTFMSVGASIPFLRQRAVDFRKTWPLIVITLIGSALGALLAVLMTGGSLKLTVSVAMIVVAVFILFRRDLGVDSAKTITTWAIVLTYVLTFTLGVYGGLFSGGYVTILTTVLVVFFGMTFTEAVASTKVINIFSSLIATAVFAWKGLVDYKLGVILSVAMFVGAYAGAHYASKMSDVWLRRIFLVAVFLLALKTLFDFL